MLHIPMEILQHKGPVSMLNTAIDNYKPELSAKSDISIIIYMKSVTLDKRTHNVIKATYLKNKLEYQESYDRNIVPIVKLVLNNTRFEIHNTTKMLLSIYYRCRELNDYTQLKEILKKRSKLLVNKLCDEIFTETHNLLADDKLFGQVGKISVMYSLALCDLTGLVFNRTVISAHTEKDIYTLDSLFGTEAMSTVLKYNLDNTDYDTLYDKTVLDSTAGEMVDKSDDKFNRKREQVENIMNPRKLDVRKYESYGWQEFLNTLLYEDESQSNNIFRDYYNSCYSSGISILEIVGAKVDLELYDYIITSITSTVLNKTVNRADIINLFVFMLVTMKLRMEIRELSETCYTDLEEELALKEKKIQDTIAERLQEVTKLKHEYEFKLSQQSILVKQANDEALKQQAEIKSLTNKLENYETEKYELDMYRRFNYIKALQESTDNTNNIDLETMIKACNKPLIIIGGNPDWQGKLAEALPEVKFYNIKDFKRYRTRLKKTDEIFINVTYTGHTSYWKLIEHLSASGIKANYLSGFPNMSRTIKELHSYLTTKE